MGEGKLIQVDFVNKKKIPASEAGEGTAYLGEIKNIKKEAEQEAEVSPDRSRKMVEEIFDELRRFIVTKINDLEIVTREYKEALKKMDELKVWDKEYFYANNPVEADVANKKEIQFMDEVNSVKHEMQWWDVRFAEIARLISGREDAKDLEERLKECKNKFQFNFPASDYADPKKIIPKAEAFVADCYELFPRGKE